MKKYMILFLMVFSFVGIQASDDYVSSDSDSEDGAIVRMPSKIFGVGEFSVLVPKLSKISISPIDCEESSEGSDEEMANSFMAFLSTKVVPGKAMEAFIRYREYLNNRGPDCLVGKEEVIHLKFATS